MLNIVPRAVVRLSCTMMLMPTILLRGAAPYHINLLSPITQNAYSNRRPVSSFSAIPKLSITGMENIVSTGGAARILTIRSMSSDAIDTDASEYPAIDIIRNEVQRRQNKLAKKISKERAKKVSASLESETTDDDNATSEEAFIVNSPKPQLAKLLATELELQNVKQQLAEITSTNDAAFQAIAPFVKKLRISPRSSRTKVTGEGRSTERSSSRLPYQVFTSVDGIEIRAGRTAAENDELSCNTDHRDGDYWWMHVSGVAGSHVVICSTDDNLKKNHPETIADAAALAAKKSKAVNGSKVDVTLTRCRYVSKPRGAPPGMVSISVARASVVRVNLHTSASRLQRITNNGAAGAGVSTGVVRGA